MRDLDCSQSVSDKQEEKDGLGQEGPVQTIFKVRQIKGDKPGINTKLEDSWAGPYTILKRNSPSLTECIQGREPSPRSIYNGMSQYPRSRLRESPQSSNQTPSGTLWRIITLKHGYQGR